MSSPYRSNYLLVHSRPLLVLFLLSCTAAGLAPDTRPASLLGREAIRRLDDLPGEVTWTVAFSPDGKQLVSAGGGTFTRHGQGADFVNVGWGPGQNFDLRIWSVASGKLLQSLKGHSATVGAVAWSTDGKRIASGSGDGTVRVWDAANGQELNRFGGHQAMVTAVVFSADGAWIVSGGRDATVRVWDAASGKNLMRIAWPAPRVADVALSPDGKQLAVCGDDRVARVYDAATGRVLRLLTGHQEYVVRVAFSPDGTRLATGGWDNTARLWDAATGKELLALRHDGRVEGLAFTPNGRRLVTGSLDQSMRVWDAEAGTELARFEGHTAPVSRVAVNPNRQFAASASWDGTVRLWRLPGAFDPGVAWQVFPEAYRPPVKLTAAVEREVAALGDESAPRREQADLTLRELGDDIVPLLHRLDPDELSPEQRVRVGTLLRGKSRLTAREAAARRDDRDFLLDCVAAGDALVARAAMNRFTQLTGQRVIVDLEASPEVRAAAIMKWRAKQ